MLQTVKQQSSSLQIALMLTHEVFTNLSFYITCYTFANETQVSTGNCRNMRGLGKSTVVFCFFEKLKYSNEKSTKFESLCQE